MTEPEGSFALACARSELLDTAKRAARMGLDRSEWLRDAPQWALDAVSERDVEAVVEMAWRGLP